MKNISYKNLTSANFLIGQKIKTRRKMLHLTQKNLAEKLGITFQQIQKYEKGINKISLPQLLNICQALKCRPNYFFDNLQFADDGCNLTLDDSLEEQLIIAFRKINSMQLKTNIINFLNVIIEHLGEDIKYSY